MHIILDPALDLVLIRQHMELLKSSHNVVVFRNPLQRDFLEKSGVSSPSLSLRSSAELNDRFDHITEFAADLRGDEKAEIQIEADLVTYYLNLGAMAEISHYIDLQATIVEVVHELSKVTQHVAVMSARRPFRMAAASAARQLEIRCDFIEVISLGISAANPTSPTPSLRRTAQTAMSELLPALRQAPMVTHHRQTLKVLQSLDSAMTQRSMIALSSFLDRAGLRARIVRLPSLADFNPSATALPEDREFIALCWKALSDFVDDVVHEELDYSARLLTALDWLQPSSITQITWAGLMAHSQRRWCLARGRPFIVIQHGFQIGSTLSPTRSVDADAFICWGEEYKRWMNLRMNDELDIRPYGNPVDQTPHRTFRELPVNGPLRVLAAPSGPLEHARSEFIDFYRGLAEIMEGRNWMSCSVRPHKIMPNRQDILRLLEGRVGIDESLSVFEAMEKADVVLTTVSSVAMDAMVMGKPVVVVNQWNEPEFFSAYGLPVLDTIHEVPAFLERLMETNGAELMLAQQGIIERFRPIGASQKTARFIESL